MNAEDHGLYPFARMGFVSPLPALPGVQLAMNEFVHDLGTDAAWTATQVCALVVTGLVSSHQQPFLRLLYNDPKMRVNGDGRPRSILVESREDREEVRCRRKREPNGKYTALWHSSTELGRPGEVFNIHSAVDWVELQLWNRFDNGFDVFLGKASVSLHQLHQQCCEATSSEGAMRNYVTTGALWFPLQTSEVNGIATHLSLQIECTFSSDPKVLRIRKELQHRRKRGKRATKRKLIQKQGDAEVGTDDQQQESSESGQEFDEDEAKNFRELVLYGDLEQEMDEDEGLQIHDDHLTAFKACQLSAQYVDHCVESLSHRIQDYSDDYCSLSKVQRQLATKCRSLRKRLQKENSELDLLIATYQRIVEKKDDTTSTERKLDQPSSPARGDSRDPMLPESELGSSPVSPTPELSAKKPVFLRTWEERERERRLEKELMKAQRIEEEKQRLIQRVLERRQREDYEALVSKFAENRRRRAARQIQRFFRSVRSALHAQRCVVESQAATLIQAVWKRFVHVKEYPHRLEARNQEAEMWLMARSEQELRQWLADLELKQREATVARAMSPPESIQSNDPEQPIDDAPSPSGSPSKPVVDAFVTTWRKLHRVFVLAHRSKGADYYALFSEMDLRKDDVLDRAELRLGARSFGVRLDRKITRALITLIRTKCGAPSKPLLVSFEQFVQGFELNQARVEPVGVIPSPEVKPEEPMDDKTTDKTLLGSTPDSHADQTNDEERLIETVRAFRAAIYDAATMFLAELGKPSSDYRAFRDALAQIFYEFDADKNGELDVNELVACMSSFNLRLDSNNISLLRELFVGDREDDLIGVAEFISFVLAHSSNDDELGLLGNRTRETIMTRVVQAQAKAGRVEDAVRIVFKAAYKRKDQQSCNIRDFMRVLNRLRLGITSAQLARLVLRLDRDGDRSISFNELLVWLRIRSKTSLGTDLVVDSGRVTASQAALQLATKKAKTLRLLLEKLALGRSFSHLTTTEDKSTSLTALFRQINNNSSGKINQEELQIFLESQDLLSIVGEEVLIELCGAQTEPSSALVAQEMMTLMDLNANEVTTLKEWLTFAQHEDVEDNDPVVIEAVRNALKDSEHNDPERLTRWFSGLPGAMQATTSRACGQDQMKVRVAEFKTALRTKLGGARSVSLYTIDQVVENLDKDRSGWITTNELCTWAFPPRDLEEILRLVVKNWQIERLNASSRSDFASNLYRRFDADGNGSLAVRELLSGFMTFGVKLTEYETRVLLIAFDLDGDGFWSESEFLTFVGKLIPEPLFEEEDAPTNAATDQTGAVESESPTTETGVLVSINGSEGSASSNDDSLLHSGSSNALSSPAYSDEEDIGVQPVEYSEDFDDD
ncbi:unnamed protein product [Phytophthora lilii]|uniref:Unnamed protein product n=1 Tax=Phytophthora lilii TaxID=2077276 RepID=A0A9W7CFW8_9STRA|nr:unnamed protein product [Phytophthora lilii]